MNEKDYQVIEERWAKAYDGDDRQAVRKAMKDVSALLAEVRRLNRMVVRIYNSGYHAGHHDTVEGQYTHILPQEMDSYQADVVEELITEYAESEVSDNG